MCFFLFRCWTHLSMKQGYMNICWRSIANYCIRTTIRSNFQTSRFTDSLQRLLLVKRASMNNTVLKAHKHERVLNFFCLNQNLKWPWWIFKKIWFYSFDFCQNFNDTGGAPWAVYLPEFLKNGKCINSILRGLGKLINEKTWSWKSRNMALSL